MTQHRSPRGVLTPWDRREFAGQFTLEQSARRVGQYAWVEMRSFEMLGAWVSTVPEADVKARFGAQSFKHAWHAELWQKALPKSPLLRPDELIGPASPAVAVILDAVAEPQAPAQTIEKLVGFYRVLIPRKIAAYTYHLRNAATSSEGPTMRSLRFALADELEDWRDGEMLLQSLIGTSVEADRAGAHQVRLERLAVAAGGINGLETIGERGDDARRDQP